MSLRLLRVLVDPEKGEEIERVLEEHGDPPRWRYSVDDRRVILDVMLRGEGNEPLLETLEKRFGASEGFRLALLPVHATVPRIEEPKEEEGEQSDEEGPEAAKPIPARISREELYTELSSSAKGSPYYLVMVALSAVVASAGLLMGDTAVIIGAMVIAPLLAPNLTLSFATTLGDLELGRSALKASLAGVAVAFSVSALAGVALTVDPEGAEIASRTRVSFGHVALALAAGAAGALSLTRGTGVGLVGVMVAVALLPPLAAAGLLIGAGLWTPGIGALLLVTANVACVNLAAIGCFLVQGIRPLSWWEEGRARRATVVAVTLWAGLVVALLAIIWIAWGS